MREESVYGGAGTCYYIWEKIPMDNRPCVIMEERRNPPMGEQRAVIIWRRDTHRDNPVIIEESAHRAAESCHYVEKEPIGITLLLWRRGTHL
jgi:hypothetical protein